MDKITLKNYRCFGEEQTARLAPLTFLVGENSTGKTSFLALIRALWDVACREEVPDFRDAPYNLGSFREIAHNRGGRGGQAKTFEGGFESYNGRRVGRLTFQVTFEERLANPFPSRRRIGKGKAWSEVMDQDADKYAVKFGSANLEKDYVVEAPMFGPVESRLVPFHFLLSRIPDRILDQRLEHPESISEAKAVEKDLSQLREIAIAFRQPAGQGLGRGRPFASAPVRSRPLRTYDPVRPSSDPEGEYIPTYLANVHHRDPDGWQILKGKLEEFGQSSGLFDELSIKSFGKSEGTPFQVQVRKFSGKGRKGPQRNLIDVGYGVSQALPLLSELLRSDAPSMFLLQQPEVHLHPSAQAALGSLFCSIAGPQRQLIVETHSDYILDRVTMDIRDKTTSLKPEDVSILYFEPGDLEVKIHSIRLDEMGNILDAPPTYRQFFVRETRRSIGL